MQKVWYIAHQGQSLGPFTLDEIRFQLAQYQGPNTMVFGPGMSEWAEARHVAALAAAGSPGTPPPVPVGRRPSDEIDYVIYGDDMQYVEVTLDPGEACVAEAGNMMFMTDGIKMETLFGDPEKSGGIFDKILDAGKRVVVGESLFIVRFTAVSQKREMVAFAAPYPGKIVPMHLNELGGEIICQKDSFLSAARGIEIGIAFQRKIMTGLFGGEGFILQRLRGDGIGFIHAGGCIREQELAAGETLRLDTGCLVAFQPTVSYDVALAGDVKTAVFGGEGIFLTTLTGPGKIWIQSLPFARLARRMARGYASGKGEGSLLGGLGRAFEAR